MPMRRDVVTTIVSALTEEEEDILTLIAKTLRAVFVFDSSEPRFHCNREAAARGNVVTFFAIPMVGSSGHPIATLQVSFPDHSVLDRESFGLWVGYAQKAAAALERAQEAEERSTLEAISACANAIIQSPPSAQQCRHAWCNTYLAAVVQLLGADGADMRLHSLDDSGYNYHLVGAVGHLADLHRRTRSVTGEGEGACTMSLLEADGVVTNTREETARLNAKVKAIEEAAEYGDALRRDLDELEATAILPLKHDELIFGSFVVDSKRRYFFTERCERIARTAARLAAAVHFSQTAAYDREVLLSEQGWMLETLSRAEGTAEQRLRGLIERVCALVGADVGSIYLWHEGPQRLILYIAHNWFCPLEDRASYQFGEGWTGGLLERDGGVEIVSPRLGQRICTKKYYESLVPPEHR